MNTCRPGDLLTATGSWSDLLAKTTYDPAGQPGQVSKIEWDSSRDESYTYDVVGNILTLTTAASAAAAASDSQQFTYDDLNRLKTAQTTSGGPAYNHTYSYDPLGNVLSLGGGAYDCVSRHRGCGSQPAHSQPHAVKKVGTNDYYCYDNHGNMTKRVEGGVTYTQSFDAENRLTSVSKSGSTTYFQYDAAGGREAAAAADDQAGWDIGLHPLPRLREREEGQH